MRLFSIDLADALYPNPESYSSFNAFFTRELRADAREINTGDVVVSPVDGVISSVGKIETGILIQAKNIDYSLEGLLGGLGRYSENFYNGQFATIYLGPADIHRVYAPASGSIVASCHIPGRHVPVKRWFVENVADLYNLNERKIILFDTNFGLIALVLVGARFVGGIQTICDEPNYSPVVHKGDEIAKFHIGSTAILICQSDKMRWHSGLVPGLRMSYGQLLGGRK